MRHIHSRSELADNDFRSLRCPSICGYCIYVETSGICLIHSDDLRGNIMLTDEQIQDLIGCSKTITKKEPAKGYREESRHLRCDLELESAQDSRASFKIFIRQSTEFIENFSIGLRYQINDPSLGSITLIRYNGPHGESSKDPDGHYAQSHIHRIAAFELESGNTQPQERHREITDRYRTFEQGLLVFFDDAHAVNFGDHFPNLQQGKLFNGYS